MYTNIQNLRGAYRPYTVFTRVSTGTTLLFQKPLTPAAILCLLNKDSVHHEGQHSHDSRHGATGPSGNGDEGPAIKHVADVPGSMDIPGVVASLT